MLFTLACFLASIFPADEILSFHPSVLNEATTIVEAEIVDTTGLLKIEQFYRGHRDTNYLRIEGLNSPNTFLEEGFRPSSNLVHQKCILFLREKQEQWITASQFTGTPSISLIMSIVWVKNDSIYFGSQPTNPGDVIFGRQGTKKHFVDNIYLHNRSMNAFCTAALAHWDDQKVGILKESLPWTLLYDETVECLGHCGAPGLKALEELLPIDTFTFSDRVVLLTYVDAGKEKVFPQLNTIFEREMGYWEVKLQTPDPAFWQGHYLPPRHHFLIGLMGVMAQNQAPGWREKAMRVRDLFANSPNYLPYQEPARLDRYMDELLKNY